MPKMKTNRAAAKRFKKTGRGKIRFNRANRSHLLTHKKASRMRRLEKPGILTGGDAKRVRRMVPYL